MTIRCSTDPFGGFNPLIDKTIGNSFQTVKYVADYCKDIRYVAENMEDVYIVAQNMKSIKENTFVTGTTGISGSSVIVPLPTQVDLTKILVSNVVIRSALTGDVYDSSFGYFTCRIASDGLHLTLDGAAPSSVQNSPFVWFLIYNVE